MIVKTFLGNFPEAGILQSSLDMSAKLNKYGKKVSSAQFHYPAIPVSETITNGLFTIDRKWNIQYWNKTAETVFGILAKDIIGKNLWDELAGILPIEFYAVQEKAFLSDSPTYFREYWGEMGSWFDVITYRSGDNLSVAFKNSTQSSTSVNPDLKLKTFNELYRLVTQVTNDCLWEWDLVSKELFWIDGGHKRVFGYSIENALLPQEFWESCLHPDDKARLLIDLEKIISGETADGWEVEYRFKKANGEYAFVHDRGLVVYDENKKPTRIIGATQDITEKVQLENKLVKERQAAHRETTLAILTAQENEREEIGKELHDNLNQVLAMANLYVQLAKTTGKKSGIYLEKSSELIVKVIEEIRRISKTLVIPGIHILGLDGNIKNLIHDLVTLHPIKIEFHTDGIDEEELGEKLQLTVFRIVQEQLNNIIKHAKASVAIIHLSKRENQITLHISDNGDGCDLLKEKKGVGIINIKSRAEIYHGQVTIVTTPGHGYELKVILPLNNDNTALLAAKSLS